MRDELEIAPDEQRIAMPAHTFGTHAEGHDTPRCVMLDHPVGEHGRALAETPVGLLQRSDIRADLAKDLDECDPGCAAGRCRLPCEYCNWRP